MQASVRKFLRFKNPLLSPQLRIETEIAELGVSKTARVRIRGCVGLGVDRPASHLRAEVATLVPMQLHAIHLWHSQDR